MQWLLNLIICFFSISGEQLLTGENRLEILCNLRKRLQLTSPSSPSPFMRLDALAFTLDIIITSVSPASCIEARINSAERMLQE